MIGFTIINTGNLCSTYPLKIAYVSYLPTKGMYNLLHAARRRFAHGWELYYVYIWNTASDSDGSSLRAGQSQFKHTLANLNAHHSPGENDLRGETFLQPTPSFSSLFAAPHLGISRLCLFPKANPTPNPGTWMELICVTINIVYFLKLTCNRSEILNKQQNVWNNGVTTWGTPFVLTWQSPL